MTHELDDLRAALKAVAIDGKREFVSDEFANYFDEEELTVVPVPGYGDAELLLMERNRHSDRIVFSLAGKAYQLSRTVDPDEYFDEYSLEDISRWQDYQDLVEVTPIEVVTVKFVPVGKVSTSS